MLHLVRHGRPLLDPARPAEQWPLDPDHADDVRRLRDAWATGLPTDALWASTAAPKVVATAQLLAGRTVKAEPDLGERRRGAGWLDDMAGTVTRAFARPGESAAPDGSRWPDAVSGWCRPYAASWPSAGVATSSASGTGRPGRCWWPASPVRPPISTGGARSACRMSSPAWTCLRSADE